MKMNKKTFAVIATLAVLGGSALFAQAAADEVETVTTIEFADELAGIPAKDISSISATVKVTKNGVTLNTKSGKKYTVKASDEIVKQLTAKDGKLVIVSGTIDKASKTFNVLKLGSFRKTPDGMAK